VKDHHRFFRQALENLRPGGWMEVADATVGVFCDDETISRAPNLLEWRDRLIEASNIFGKPMGVARNYREWLVEAGFVNVKEDVYKVCLPVGPFEPDCARGRSLTPRCCLGTLLAMAARSKTERAGLISTATDARGSRRIFVCLVHEGVGMGHAADTALVGRRAEGAPRSEVPWIFAALLRLWAKAPLKSRVQIERTVKRLALTLAGISRDLVAARKVLSTARCETYAAR
jgi:hypothetical protein